MSRRLHGVYVAARLHVAPIAIRRDELQEGTFRGVVNTRPMRFTGAALAAICLFGVVLLFPLRGSAGLRRIDVGVRIQDLNDVDELHERWDVSGELITTWVERKFKYRPNGPYDDHRDISPNAIRIPRIGFANAIEVPTFRRVDLFVRPDGRVFLVNNFRATLSTHLDFRRFPFDTEKLPLIVVPLGHFVDQIILIPDPARSQLVDAAYSGLSQWQLLGLSMSRYTENNLGDTDYGVKFALQVRRNSQSYVWKFILPLCLIVVISWISFWLAPTDFKSKDLLATAVTTLLIVVAFTLSITTLLPRTSYQTYIDAFLLTCFLFVIAAIAAIVGINALEFRGRDERALAVRRFAGALLPVSFIVIQLAVFVYFESKNF